MWAGSPWADRGWADGPASSAATQTITPGLFTNTQTFYAPTVSPGAVTIAPGLLSSTNAFYAARVFDPSTPASSIRFDITTGRIVKIINSAVTISL